MPSLNTTTVRIPSTTHNILLKIAENSGASLAQVVYDLAQARLQEIEKDAPNGLEDFSVSVAAGPGPAIQLEHPDLPALTLSLDEAESIEWQLDFRDGPLSLTSAHGGRLVKLIQRTTGLVIAVDGREVNLSRPGAAGLARLLRHRRRQAATLASRI